MTNLEKLIERAKTKGKRLSIKFNPEQTEESWHIKYYPHAMDDAHYYSFASTLDDAAYKLLDELEGAI